jgi:NhaC family Na+:H+ antiporter
MNRINNFVSLTFTTVATATLVNVIIPDQYLGIALPGRMYAKEYDKRNIDRVELTMALGVGGSLTSSMIPWNTCGIFMASVLGVTAYDYFLYTFGNLFMLVGIIGYAVFEQRKHKYKFNQEGVMDSSLVSE